MESYILFVEKLSNEDLLEEYGQLNCYSPESTISPEMIDDMMNICKSEILKRMN